MSRSQVHILAGFARQVLFMDHDTMNQKVLFWLLKYYLVLHQYGARHILHMRCLRMLLELISRCQKLNTLGRKARLIPHIEQLPAFSGCSYQLWIELEDYLTYL